MPNPEARRMREQRHNTICFNRQDAEMLRELCATTETDVALSLLERGTARQLGRKLATKLAHKHIQQPMPM